MLRSDVARVLYDLILHLAPPPPYRIIVVPDRRVV